MKSHELGKLILEWLSLLRVCKSVINKWTNSYDLFELFITDRSHIDVTYQMFLKKLNIIQHDCGFVSQKYNIII